MDNSVVIKGNKNGIVIVLDPELPFEALKERCAQKFIDSSKFLGDCKTAISFEGRSLSAAEELELLDVIRENSKLDVVCVLDKDDSKSKSFEDAINEKLMDYSGNVARFYKGNLRSGQVLEMDTSVIVIGDVNPGASVVSNGNIIVLGSLKGTAYAGASGNINAFVLALDMMPIQIRISDVIARSPDKPDKQSAAETKIAYLEDGRIYTETVSKNVLNSLKI